MRSAILGCLMIVSLTPICLPQEQTKPASPAQNPSAEARPATNPIPDKYTNLQILPKDITKPQLVNVMKQFSITFGVRCSYCHTVSDDLTTGSFDSDDKETKRKARDLMKAIVDMNALGSKS
jgi:hypothetical protein